MFVNREDNIKLIGFAPVEWFNAKVNNFLKEKHIHLRTILLLSSK